MFTETVTSPDEVSTGNVSEVHALTLLRRACNRGYAIEALRTGGAVIRWSSAGGGRGARRAHSLTLTPHLPVTPDDLDLSNLRIIDAVPVVRYGASDRYAMPVIAAGTYEIRPAQAERLVDQGFLLHDREGNIRLTLVARLTLLAAEHTRMDSSDRTTTWCSCGLAVHCKSAEAAQARQLGHLAAVSADFVQSLDAAFTASVASV
jgi:hypothetical protein